MSDSAELDLEEMVKVQKPPEESEIKSNVENLELYSDGFPFSLSLRVTNFEDESSYNKFVKNVEKLIRQCSEYKQWTDYIRDVVGVTSCALTDERMDQVKVDIHHHVPSLFTLVKALVNEKINNNQEFCSFDIAMETIKVHFTNQVGYVPLLKSIHEKFHNGFLDIPVSFVYGDYQWFIKNYSEYLDQEDLDVINERLVTYNSNLNWSRNSYNSGGEQ